MKKSNIIFALLLLVHFFHDKAIAQCPERWFDGSGLPGTDDDIFSMVEWDPDGPGPLPTSVVFTGAFNVGGTVLAHRIARWEPATDRWFAMDAGLVGVPRKLLALPSGDLLVAIETGNGTSSFARVLRWTGSSWTLHAPELTVEAGNSNVARIMDMKVLQNGSLVVAGNFTSSAGVPLGNIASWNGTAWSSLNGGMNATGNQWVNALAVLPSGVLVAGGIFTSAGGATVNRIAQWNGTAWSSVSTGVNISPDNTTPYVSLLAVMPNGSLIASGAFLRAGGVSVGGVARWNGSSWQPVGTGGGTNIDALCPAPDGSLYATGYFTSIGDTQANYVARWDGTTWRTLGTGLNLSGFCLLARSNSDIVVGGEFTAAGGVPAGCVARWNGASWSAITAGMFRTNIDAMATLQDDSVVVGGLFSNLFGVPAANMARWNGFNWAPFGGGANAKINVLKALTNGDVVAAGEFTSIYGTPANRIARIHGSSAFPYGSGFDSVVRAVTTLPNGNLIAAGDFTTAGGVLATRIARWDGARWSALPGTPITQGGILALQTMANGDIVAGGTFVILGSPQIGNLARHNGTSWSLIGPFGPPGTVRALAAFPNGDLVIGGDFTSTGGAFANKIARWNGAQWSNMSTGLAPLTINAFAFRPNGDLYVCGEFRAPDQTSRGFAKWSGTTWTITNDAVDRLASEICFLAKGDLVLAGAFTSVGNHVSVSFAHHTFGGDAPAIATQPTDTSACVGGHAAFSLIPVGTDPFHYRWQYSSPGSTTWTDANNGPLVNSNGSLVATVTDAWTQTIHVQPHYLFNQTDEFTVWRCIATNVCEAVTSDVASLSYCPADFNCDSVTDLFDYLDFVKAFADNQPAADFNHDNAINYFDYLDFVQAFSSGC